MRYRKARTRHNEISLRLTYSTHNNPAEKKKTMSINHTALIFIKYTTHRLSAAEIREGWAITLPYQKKKNRKGTMFFLSI
jgi:hypothetical protein